MWKPKCWMVWLLVTVLAVAGIVALFHFIPLPNPLCSLVTGLGLASGFYLKDAVVTHAGNWKRTIEYNLSHDLPIFHNEATNHRKLWRQDPVAYQKRQEAVLAEIQAEEMLAAA